MVTVHLPPLRERRGDIPLLARTFISEFAQRHHKEITGLPNEVARALTRYDWPGNVRELKNCIESMVVVTKDTILGLDDLPGHISPGRLALPAPTKLSGMSLRQVERELIRSTIAECNGNRKEAARRLGIGERTLYRKLSQYELNV